MNNMDALRDWGREMRLRNSVLSARVVSRETIEVAGRILRAECAADFDMIPVRFFYVMLNGARSVVVGQ